MSDLDKKLADICANYVDDAVDFSGYVKAIKQAFIDAGYVQIPNLKPGDYIGINTGEVRLNGDGTMTPVKRMTGKEWYDRFEDIMANDSTVFDSTKIRPGMDIFTKSEIIVDSILRAAKKASGIK